MSNFNLRLCKAEPIGTIVVPKTTIITIDDKLPVYESLDIAKKFFDNQAIQLVDALVNSLPQGTTDAVIIRLMEKKVSLYNGTMT